MLSVYFNRTYATNVHFIQLLRANPDGRPLRIIGTHVDPHSPVLQACDEAGPEPAADVTGERYVEWALDFTRVAGVDIFIPRLELAALAGAGERFAAQGVTLMAPPAATVEHFGDKAATYADAARRGIRIPPYHVVTDGQTLKEAFAAINAEFGSACLKPLVGVGGDGFRILSDQPLTFTELAGPLTAVVGIDAAARALDEETTRVPFMVLPFLPGPEISVDVLADQHGQVRAAIGRSKDGRQRRIVDDASCRDAAATLVHDHHVSYLSNAQFRYWQGPSDAEPVPYLLELNTRAAGGLFQTALAGVNLPWAAVRLALGEDPGVRTIEFDIPYTTVSSVVRADGSDPTRAFRPDSQTGSVK